MTWQSHIRALLWIFTLASVVCSASVPSQESPRDVLENFCEMDASGHQLTTEGWTEVARLFVTPGSPHRDRVIIIRDFVVSQPVNKTDTAQLLVEYIRLGEMNSATGKVSYLPPLKLRKTFVITRIGRNQKVDREHMPVQHTWKIMGSPPEPHVNVDAAIVYLHTLAKDTRNPAIRRNANRGVLSLSKLRHAGQKL